jgi:hypothetical protein
MQMFDDTNPLKHQVFISYSRRDTEIMRLIRNDLQAGGLTIWTDEGIEPGAASWKKAIEDAISQAGCLVGVLSPDAKQSPWVNEELNFAELQEKPIFLIHARGSERDAIPFGFSTFQRVDIRDSTRYSIEINNLVQIIQKRLRERRPISNLSTFDMIGKTILPQPFDWCEIPAGKVTLEDARDIDGMEGGIFSVARFFIGKYPITNAQFQVFVDALDGYRAARWWSYSKMAEDWHTQNPQPQASQFGGADLPRTNVCWYESIAFCLWLSARTGLNIVLPTDQQWQRSAQGDDGRSYPWGNEFDPKRCNIQQPVGQTTPVTRYPEGASPYGVMDMCSNVWEWCLSDWKTGSTSLEGSGYRVQRGASWYSESRHRFLITHRDGFWSINSYNFVGFRIAYVP